jgi:YD repeat-containing protein
MTALPDPCTPTLSADGYDGVTKNFYDAAGQQRAVCAAVGTPLQLHTQYDYTPNGKPWFIVDANQNLTELDYDELDRLAATYFPVKLTASLSLVNRPRGVRLRRQR